ncbi:permease for cytosine/purines, uracil, thiamine, allantoin-domain-containing protein [Melanogaster broomeanus]|nr:permease for cytosine/purines, uracil, thiamine, allantoin-domain-containing protein [Melanogaster broomeanus]
MKFFNALLSPFEVSQTSGTEAHRKLVTSEDLLPVPPEKRTWDGFNYVAFWMIASGMIQSGMSWWQAWLSICLGYGIVAPFIVLNARPGAVFHITFPAGCDSMASIGGTCVLVMLRAMWPSVNSIPPTADIVFLVWCIVKAKGVGPILHQKGTLEGSKLAWAMVAGAMSCISNKVTLVTNAPDFASRAKRPSAAVYPQLITMPLTYALLSLLGVIVSSSSQVIYGEAVWSPVTLLGMFLDDNPSPAARFGNIRRGGYIAAIIGLCICPWNLTKSNNSFTSYLSGYAVFLSSIAGVMATEYWVIRKGHYRVADLYTTRRDGWYSYTYGINFRAYAAYIAGILINVVGFVGDTGRKVPVAATHIFDLSFFTGFGTSALVYIALNWLYPTHGKSDVFEEVDVSNFEDGVGGCSESNKERESADADATSVEELLSQSTTATTLIPELGRRKVIPAPPGLGGCRIMYDGRSWTPPSSPNISLLVYRAAAAASQGSLALTPHVRFVLAIQKTLSPSDIYTLGK